MARKRFKPAEREVFTADTRVEWLNTSFWKPGTITGPIAVDDIGVQYVPIRNDAPNTRTVSKGEQLRGYPGRIRLAGAANSQ